EPVFGRQFLPEEDRPGATRVAILSHGLWQRRFAADPNMIGRIITLEGNPVRVVGIMPKKFRFPENADVWIPLAPVFHNTSRANRSIAVYARLKKSISFAAALRETQAIAESLSREHLEYKDWGASIRTLREDAAPRDIRLLMFTMMGAVTLVLLVAC